MKRSLFTKYLVTFTIIILISFALLTFAITSFLRGFATDTATKEVEEISLITNELIELSYDESLFAKSFTQYVASNKKSIDSFFSLFGDYSKDKIFILTDESGNILHYLTNDNDLEITAQTISSSIIESMKTDQNYVEKGTFGRIFTKDFLIVGSSIYSQKTNLVGYLFVCKSSSSAMSLISSVGKSISITGVWILLLALIATYFITERFIRPLQTMTKATKEYSHGNMQMRMPIKGNDEITDLAIAFNQMADSIEKTDKMRNAFLANVSHDLRTPMTTIAGFVDGILAGSIPEDLAREKLQIVSSEAHRLSRLVSEILDLSKIESGERTYNFTAFDICELARVILISFEMKIDEKKLDVEFNCDDENIMVFADQDAIHQVLYNLIDNAIKYSSEKAVLKIEIKKIENQKVNVQVYNEGPGIPEQDLPYVFERFYKIDKSRSQDRNGAGLGLYIVKTILEQMNERISVSSEENKYCQFDFTLTQE